MSKSRIQCFLLLPTGRSRRALRRFVFNSRCPLQSHGHDASVSLGPVDGDDHTSGDPLLVPQHGITREDPRWPVACVCGYAFHPVDEWQVSHHSLYRRVDTGEEMTLREAPPGAMWYAPWMGELWRGLDGRTVLVRLPNGHDWCIDGIASNCDKQHDRAHKCWVRHGEAPVLTVDKNGPTCGAGAGSIQAGDYHGFLRDGYLEEC